MRKPRLEDFDPNCRKRQPDAVNLTGVVPLQAKSGMVSSEIPTTEKQTAPSISSPNKPESPNVVSRYHGSVVSRHHDTTIFSSDEASVIQLVRKAVKEFGKEAATHRFTQAEKRAIAQIVFAYGDRAIRTTENEITRIAVNFLLYDYQSNGENSILHQCLLSLNE